MIKRFRKFYGSLTGEQDIFFNRYVVAPLVCLISLAVTRDDFIPTVFSIYFAVNCILHWIQHRDLFPRNIRLLMGNLTDVVVYATLMIHDPVNMAMLYPMSLWVSLGFGFRFGLKWLAVATLTTTGAFVVVLQVTDYWQDKLVLGYSLAVGLLVIPAYCSKLIRKLSAARDAAQTANKAKSYFLASVSHELRTPLNAIIGYGNHLKQTDLSRSQQEMVESSVTAGQHLLFLIEQLLQVSKSEVSPVSMAKRDFVPTDLLTEVRNIMRVRAEEKGIYFKIMAEVLSDRPCNGPAETIRNLLINLASNAVKFTETGGVTIKMDVSNAPQGEILHITVSDTGIGIAEDAREKIFQPFQQADETVSNRFGGTGLGLAICKQLAEQAGGRISVESMVGKGSSFSVEIPVGPPQSENTEEQQGNGVVKIIAIGGFDSEMLSNAQSSGNFSILHAPCDTVSELEETVAGTSLEAFQVALIPAGLAQMLGADHPVWGRFAECRTAPVLVQENADIDMEDIALRAAFASVIPATPNFEQLRSAIRIGCSFAGNLPLAQQNEAETESATLPQKILVADDNRTNRQLLATILETAGHEVHLVTDGDEALDVLENQSFDLFLLDVNMPRLNGIETCKMWRQIEGVRSHLPIFGVTADATEETEKRCLDAGMDRRITKPIDARSLLALIQEVATQNASESARDLVVDDPLGKVSPIGGSGVNRQTAIDMSQIEYLQSIGNAEFVGEMVAHYIADVSETYNEFAASVAEQDVSKFRFFAHAFKSSSFNIGASRLAALCGELEMISENQFRSEAALLLQKVDSELAAVRAELSDIALENPRQAAG